MKKRKIKKTVRNLLVVSSAGLLVAGIVWAADTYYNIDTQKIIVNEVQRVTQNLEVVGSALLGDGGDTNYLEVNSTGDLAFYGTADNIDLSNVTDQKISFTGGNIGVGTTDPDSVFHVASGDVYMAGDDGYTFDNTSASNDLYVEGNIESDGTIYGAVSSSGGTFGNIQIAVTTDQTIDTSSGNLVLDSTTGVLDLDAGTINLESQATSFLLSDDTASSLLASAGGVEYLKVTTSTGGEEIVLGNTTDNPNITIDGGTGTLDFGTSNNARVVNIGTGTAADTIQIGGGGTSSDTITIGDLLADVSLSGVSEIAAGTGDALTITANDSSVWSTTSGLLTLQFDGASGFKIQNDAATPVVHFEISSDGEVTVRSDDNQDINFDAGTGTIMLNSEVGSDEVIQGIVPIFGFDMPAQTSSGTFKTISRVLESDPFPAAAGGTTRRYKFIIRYADELSTGSSSWSICAEATAEGSCTESFTVANSSSTDLDKGDVLITDFMDVSFANPWRLAVKTDGSNVIRIYGVYLAAYDRP